MSKSDQPSYVFANIKTGIHHAISQIKHILNVESITPVTGRFDLAINAYHNA